MDSIQKFVGNVKKGIDITCKTVRVCNIKAVEAYKNLEDKLIKAAVSCQIKSNVAYEKLMILTIASVKDMIRYVNSVRIKSASFVEAKIGKVHFDMHHFVMTSGSAVVVFALTFVITGVNRSQVSAAVLEPQVIKDVVYNKEVIKINYGDDTPLKNVINEVLADQTGNINEAKAITLKDGSVGYEMGDYIVSFDKIQTRDLKRDTLTMSVQTKETYTKEDFKKLSLQGADDKAIMNDAVVNTYKLDVEYVDVQAPSIALSTTSVEMNDVDTFDANAYVQSIVDNYDGVMQDYSVSGSIEQKDEERYAAGDYTITYQATDSHGNQASVALQVKVNETEEEKDEEELATSGSNGNGAQYAAAPNVASYAGAGSILDAAYAQLGNGQDCTMLVTNSLRAVGINYHSAPAGYIGLGTVVPTSEAQPGDIIYYADGGAGVPHVSIYAGGGQAVHGGYMGTTRVASAWLGSGYVVVRVQ